jgi:hypothetical protein
MKPSRSNLSRSGILRIMPLVALVVALAACRSGTWADDPRNFERAWDQPAPSDLETRHSWYWRSAHFTREEAYYFQFARHDGLMRVFIAEKGLQGVADPISVAVSDYSCFSRPLWFAPKPMDAYNVWVTPPNASRGLLLEDRTTHDWFVSACQL